MELFLQLESESTPMPINKTTVRWAGSQGIGIEFLAMEPTEHDRLKRVVEQLSVAAGQALIVPKDELPKA